MKKTLLYVLIGLLLGAGLMYFLWPARYPNETKPAEPTSFYAVTGKLDAGGDLYIYFSTERLIRTIDGLIAKFAKAMPAQAGGGESAAIAFAIRTLGKLGLNEISGVGLSNVSLPEGLQRTRLVIHHYPEKNRGLIWQLGNPGPHELTDLRLLPADTALAAFGELRLDNLWAWVKKELDGSGISGAKNFAAQVEPTLAAQGIQLPKLLGSLTGSAGYLITLDKSRKITIPGGERSWAIPLPGLAIVFGVKDATLFDLLKAKLPMAAFSEKEGRKTLQFPVLPAPFPVQPCLTAEKDVLVVASTPDLAGAILQARAKGDGLVKEAEFQELARHAPDRGNGFSFVSPRLWRIYADIIEKALAGQTEANAFKDIIFSIFPRELKAYSVMANESDGPTWTVCHNLSPELVVLMPVAGVAGVASAVAIPNFLNAAQKGKQKSTMGDLKAVGTAIESYITDYNRAPAADSFADLKKLLEPFYIKSLPLKDAWGNDLLYKRSGSGRYAIASPGKDGLFLGWEQEGRYSGRSESDFGNDIIFANGQFVYGPETN